MMAKSKKQKEFLSRCATSVQPVEDILDDLVILPQTLVNWMDERDFKFKLHGMRRFLRRARDLQLEAASMRAATLLSRVAGGDELSKMTPARRAACVDVIRLARDSRARRRAQDADVVNRERRLAHPDLSDAEAAQLAQELSGSKPVIA